MLSASGCSEPCSKLAAIFKMSSLEPSSATMSVTSGLPLLSVPVLSKIIVSILFAASSGSPPRIKIPCSAPLPVATMMLVGVARPIAHGHAMTITDTNARTAKVTLAPSASHAINVTMLMPITTGTNHDETQSAKS